MNTNWVILTGEYPPQNGGVADYTRILAAGLIAAGDSVEIWAPPCTEPAAPGSETVCRLPDHFGARGLAVLSRRLARKDPKRILLVQYVPHAFGYKAMNLPFCAWLLRQRRERIWTMFHEVAYPFEPRQRPRHRFLAAINHLMAAMVARASRRAFISIPAWEPKIRAMGAPHLPIQWTPVPSNLSLPTTLAERNGRPVIAHFGTYGGPTANVLREILTHILQSHPDVAIWLLGRGSETFAASLPSVDRVQAIGSLPSATVSSYLAAADVILQPYTEGVTTRRSTLMAGLFLGRAIVTTEGPLTEPLWRQTDSVVLAPATDPARIARETVALLHDEPRRRAIGEKALALYQDRFDARFTIAALRLAAQENP